MLNFKKIAHKYTIGKFKYSKSVISTGVTFDEYCKYLYSDLQTDKPITESKLFGKTIKRNNTFWFVQNVEEVFVDEVYKFESDNKSPLILDCGSNIGLSIIYFKMLFPNSKIIAFEPDLNIYKTCLWNLKSFGIEDIELHNAAVWKNNETLEFLADNSLGGKVVAGNPSSNTIKINSVRLKEYLNQEIDFLKIDIEGAEYEVLVDCQDELSFVKNLFVEYHSSVSNPQYLNRILSIISNAGFRYYVKSVWNTMTHPFMDYKKINSIDYDLLLNIYAYRSK